MTSEGLQATSQPAPLIDVHSRSGLKKYLAELIARRRYIAYVAMSDVRARHLDTVLGNLWHLLNPILQIAVYQLIFGLLIGTDRGVDNFFGYLAIGVFVYGFTQRTATLGALTLVQNRGLIRLLSFPRVVLPITSAVTEFLSSVPSYAVMVFVAYAAGESPSLRWLAVAPLFLGQSIMNTGFAMVTARAAHHFRDVQQILPFVFRLGFYGSGVLFDVNAYMDKSDLKWVFQANPLYCYIELYRWALLDRDIDPILLVSASAWTVGAFVFGFFWFRQAEGSYGNE